MKYYIILYLSIDKLNRVFTKMLSKSVLLSSINFTTVGPIHLQGNWQKEVYISVHAAYMWYGGMGFDTSTCTCC